MLIDLNGKIPKILVIGDLMIDHYLWGSSERISPEAPVQIININNESSILGGAGNVVNNLHSLGADVDIMSVIGYCNASLELTKLLKKIKIDTKYLFLEKGRITSKKNRIIASQQQVVRFDRENTLEINSKSENAIINTFTEIVSNYDAILLSDYGKGVLTDTLTQSVISIARKNNIKVLVDPKGSNYSKYSGAYLLTPNIKEASKAMQIEIKDDKSLKHVIKLLKAQYNLGISIITLSEEGIASYQNELEIFPTFAKEVYDVTGAGDTVLASLGYALAINMNINEAIKFSNLAAGVVVGKIGSATVSMNEIIEYESSLHKSNSSVHIKDKKEIKLIVKELRLKEKKIVFTNGCFDILHSGHIRYLEEAKSFGDILIVGLNSDKSTKRLKGENRPINSEIDRAYILASIEVVDYVVIFEEDTPFNLIKAIKPDFLVKGGDYKEKDIIGKNIAKELKIVSFFDGKSTSEIIDRVRKHE